MDFEFTDDQKLFRATARQFARKEIAPRAAEIDRTREFPVEIVRKLADLGFLGITIPVEYGGAGADVTSYILAIEEISRHCASTAMIIAAHCGICYYLYLSGTEEQKHKYLTPLASGQKLGAGGATEPDAGSDLGLIRTTAELVGDKYRLNGLKCFISNAAYAGTYGFLARSNAQKGTRGLSCFVLDADTPGVSVGKIENKIGLRASCNCEVIFENCEIPKENMVGKEGEGLRVLLAAADRGRIAYAAIALGIMKSAIEAAKRYAISRVQFGQRIADHQAIRMMISEMAIRRDCAELLIYRAASCADKHPTERSGAFTRETNIAKVYATEAALEVTNMAMEIHGGYGLMEDYPVERYMRDARVLVTVPPNELFKAYTIPVAELEAVEQL